MSASDAELLGEVATALHRLGPDELRVVARIVQRLELGTRCYGRLRVEADARDWVHEAEEELLDGCVYLAAASLRGRP